jgi:hypothetical protein
MAVLDIDVLANKIARDSGNDDDKNLVPMLIPILKNFESKSKDDLEQIAKQGDAWDKQCANYIYLSLYTN